MHLLVKELNTVVTDGAVRGLRRSDYIASLTKAWFIKMSSHIDVFSNFLFLWGFTTRNCIVLFILLLLVAGIIFKATLVFANDAGVSQLTFDSVYMRYYREDEQEPVKDN